MNRVQTIYIHFNKRESKNGTPWTIHTSSGCTFASEIIIKVPVATVWKPNKKTNPRAMLKVKGYIFSLGNDAYEIRPEDQ